MTTPTPEELRRIANEYSRISVYHVPDSEFQIIAAALTRWADELDALAMAGQLSGETPLTDAVWANHNAWTDEDGATEAICALRDHGRDLERRWASDQAIFRGALQLLKEAGLAPGSTELIAAAARFDATGEIVASCQILDPEPFIRPNTPGDDAIAT